MLGGWQCIEITRQKKFQKYRTDIIGYLECMTKDEDKLDHLEVGKVLLPPNETAVFGSHGSQHVVDIHHNMYEGVDKTKESAVPT